MARNAMWGLTPRESIEAECARRGADAVVAGCVALLRGEAADPDLLRALGGPGAEKFLDGVEHDDTYWLRVWALRGLLWQWGDSGEKAVLDALRDESWRVREMAAKVVARHLLGGAVAEVSELCDDPVPRVRRVAERALARLVASDA